MEDDYSEQPRRRPSSRREAWEEPRRTERPARLDDERGGGRRPDTGHRPTVDEWDELAPGRSLLRRDDPARVAARSEARARREEADHAAGRSPRPVDDEPDQPAIPRRVPPRRPDQVDDEPLRGGVLPRRSAPPDDERPVRPLSRRGEGDVAPRRGELEVARRRGDADDRPRRAGTDDRPRRSRADEPPRIGRAQPAVTGRAVVAEPAQRPTTVSRPSARPAVRPLAAEPEFIRRVNPFELPDPRGYAHATVASGQVIFLSGQVGADLDGRIVDGGMVNQFDRAVQNLLIALAAAGGGPEHLARVSVEVTSIDEYKANPRPIGHFGRSRLGGGLPALSLVEVRRFWDAGALVQISAQAVLP